MDTRTLQELGHLGTVGTLQTLFQDNRASRACYRDEPGKVSRSVPSVPTDPASALLSRCQALDVRLWVESGGLRFDAPKRALDAGLRAELVANKAGLIALLTAPPGELLAEGVAADTLDAPPFRYLPVSQTEKPPAPDPATGPEKSNIFVQTAAPPAIGASTGESTGSPPPDPWPCDPSALPSSALGDWPPRAPELATWPTSWRARWGARANELEAAGEPWPRAERTAFVELVAARIAAGLPPAGSPAEAEADRQAVELTPAPPARSSIALSPSPRPRAIAPTMFDRRPAEAATVPPDGPSALPSTDRPPPAVDPATDAIGAPGALPFGGHD